ncbi:endonuclease/exonuclease/phosphatase family protein [Streptomyces sp. CA-253872]|uniref:endonuclease/exonuclease/phosphatase family protein n=1 Tax=Streptomyces sp. CA-253872 TaxID=3240067 RepID=UPI003D8AD041
MRGAREVFGRGRSAYGGGDTGGRRPLRLTARLLGGLLLLGLSLVLLCRAAGRDGPTPVPQLLAFLPWLTAPALLGLLLAAYGRWRAGTGWGVLVVAGLCGALLPGATQRADDPGSGTPLRVLSANVEFGHAAPALVGEVRRTRPDLVLVPECPARCVATLRAGLPAWRYVSRAAGEGSAGSLVLSRHPLRPTRPVPAQMTMPGADMTFAGRTLRVQLAHPKPPLPGLTTVWETELARLARTAPGVDVMAGDFNASQDHAAFRALLAAGPLRDTARTLHRSRVPTWPSRTAPVIGTQIDHVLYGRRLAARAVRFVRIEGTDHLAVEAELVVRGHTPQGAPAR